MSSITRTYLLPAIILNPAFILHLINTFASRHFPPLHQTASVSPHLTMESLGPLPGATPYLDMHANDQLCWGYTVIMVIVQIFAFGRVQDNRVRRKSAKVARLEKERVRKENAEASKLKTNSIGNGHAAGMNAICDELEERSHSKVPYNNGRPKGGNGYANDQQTNGISIEKTEDTSDKENTPETEGSMTETSEEEMFI